MVQEAMRSEGVTARRPPFLAPPGAAGALGNQKDDLGLLALAATLNTSAFRVSNKNGVVFDDAGNVTGEIPAQGAGAHLMWYPSKAALPVGYIGGTQWDGVNVGYYSVAMGRDTIASGRAAARPWVATPLWSRAMRR
jgi:hypothetical protein